LIAEFSRTLWDWDLRELSGADTRRVASELKGQCGVYLALLDRRFLAGDPHSTRTGRQSTAGHRKDKRAAFCWRSFTADQERLTRYGSTIFHLEPNVKESPGGMRDFQATVWLRQIVEEKRESRKITVAEESYPLRLSIFLGAIRCFLHYKNARNDNTLTYELQAAAAERRLAWRQCRKNAFRVDATVLPSCRTLNRQLLRYWSRELPSLTLRQRLFHAARPQTGADHGKYCMVREGLLEVVDRRRSPTAQ